MEENEIIDFINNYQKEFFEILEEFFTKVTGKPVNKFAPINGFPDSIHKLGESFKNNKRKYIESLKAYNILEEKIRKLYSEKGIQAFKIIKLYNGYKLIHGGSSRFEITHLNATRRSLLYSDMILIPDPILPWIEIDRKEEKYRHVLLLHTAFNLLHLKDLVNTSLDAPPIFIFPSWEKSLEAKDKQTIENSLQLGADFCSCYIDSGIKTFNDVVEFVKKNEELFLKKVDENALFVAPGSIVGGSLKEQIANYKKETQQWRSNEWNNKLSKLTNGEIVLNALFERIQPHFHLLENSSELNSNPFICIHNQAYYFQLISSMFNKRLENIGVLDNKTTGILKALSSTKLDFLSNIPDPKIIELRKTSQNISFRRELRDLVNSLPETHINDIGHISSEVCKHIDLLISNYHKQIDGILNKYQAKYKYSALLAAGGLIVTFIPSLAPFLGANITFALASAGKYISDKFSEINELKMISKSLMGVIALAKKHDEK